MNSILKYLSLLCVAMLTVGCDNSSENQTSKDELTLTLSASSLYVALNNAENNTEVEFTAILSDETDVTSSASLVIYQVVNNESVALQDASFEVEAAGEYVFYATYNEIESSQLTIKGLDSLPEAAADASPEKFDAFRKHAFGLIATGLECPNCYKLLAPLHYFEEEDTDGDLIMVEVHEYPNDPMKCEASYWMDQRMGRLGFPTLRFALPGKPDYYIATADNVTADDVAEVVDLILSTPAQTAISATTVIEGDLLRVRADIKIASEGEYKIGVLLVEDGIYGVQDAATAAWMNTHDSALCGAYPLSFSMTEMISNTKYQSAESTHLFYCEFDLAQLTTIQDRANCRVVIFTYNNYDLLVDNAIQFPMGSSHDVVYEL